jgi:hypothetical protein
MDPEEASETLRLFLKRIPASRLYLGRLVFLIGMDDSINPEAKSRPA